MLKSIRALVFGFCILLRLSTGAEVSNSASISDESTQSWCFDREAFSDAQIVFETRPFDYQVDLSLRPAALMPAKLYSFNPYFSLLSDRCIAYFVDKWFDMFCFLYPGLHNVPLHPSDIEGLIIFGVIRLLGNDPTFFPVKFISLAAENGRIFADSEIFLKFSAIEDLSSFTAQDSLQILFEWAMRHYRFYTAESIFKIHTRSFERKNLISSIRISRHSGDLRLVNRIVSQLESISKIELFASRVQSCTWPKHETALFSNNGLLKISNGTSRDSIFKMNQELGMGTYGRCFKIISMANGKVYALKLFSKRSIYSLNPRNFLKVDKRIET
jgi:hypothetical protein